MRFVIHVLILLDLPKTSIDVAVFYCNDNTYDRMNVNEILDNYIDNKISINVLTYETPFELLKVKYLFYIVRNKIERIFIMKTYLIKFPYVQ